MPKTKPDDEKAIARGALRDALGLPPGDDTPHGKGRPDMDPKVPHGTLTSDDPARRDGTPVDRNSGTDE